MSQGCRAQKKTEQLVFSCTGACWEICSSFVHTLLMDGVLKESGCFNGVFIIEKLQSQTIKRPEG